MDIKAMVTAKVEEIVKKVKEDKDFAANFKANPAKAVSSVLGVDIPEEQVNNIVTAVKAKIGVDSLAGLAGMFGKK